MSCCGESKRRLAPADVIAARRATCKVCDIAERKEINGKTVPTTKSLCLSCNCPIMGLIRFEDGKCPEGKW